MRHSKLAAHAVSNPFRPSSLAWVAIPLGAFGFLIWTNVLRVQRVENVSGISELSGTAPAIDTSTPAGRRGWQPRLIVPEHDNTSYEWLDQTRQMFARREWRVRHIDYENAPFGREVSAASPYRWWLGTLAWLDHTVSGRPVDWSVERAALFADPLLHLLLLGAATVFVAWQFGVLPAALLSMGLAAVFPFAAGFLPGAPNDQGLVLACVFWSVLLLLAGIRAAHSMAADTGKRAGRWFFVAGVMGGLGLWIGVASQVPVLAGIALGGFIAAWVARDNAPEKPGAATKTLPWLTWALGGAAASFAGYLIEYFPAHLGSWQLRAVHPLYALAWLGGGALLARTTARIQGASPGRGLREIGIWVLAGAAVVSLPIGMWRTHSLGFLETNLSSLQLTRLSGEMAATSLWTWMVHEGITLRVWATLLPVLLVLPAGWLVLRRATGMASRVSIAVALGPVCIAVGFAHSRLSWWNQVDVVLLALLVATTAAIGGAVNHRFIRWVWSGFLAAVFLTGAVQMVPEIDSGIKNALDEAQIGGLVERDLARWLAKHIGTGNAVILAPHSQTITLHYYAGLRGLATLSRDNLDGLGAAIRIVSASTPEEAKELIDQRGVTHIVIPSWDSYLDAYTRMGMGKIEGTFYERLTYWRLPPWLKPVPYQLPTITGFEGQSVTILEVVEDQEDAAALSRSAEYFVEMGLLDQAAYTGQALRRFPADLGALVARAQVEIARDDRASLERTFESLLRRLTGGADRGLPWDRRVSLAVVLARNKRADLAREHVKRCLAEIDEAKVRSLNTGALYRLQVLGKAYGLGIADQRLHQLALDLLPDDLRTRLAQ
jgi:hypothetical protein